jgi:hypothetical protein
MSAFNTPILFIIFNRPDVTKIVFERIREIKPLKLYVAADGARNDKLVESELCNQARAIIEAIDWPCNIKKLYREENLGCGKAVSSAISWFFEQEEKGIIIEDDILADLSFFAFCENLLEQYKDDKNVMAINGCNFQQGIKHGDGTYYFSAFPHVWGWATWRRAWKRYDFNLSDLNYFYNLNKLKRYFKSKETIDFWHEIFFKMNRKAIDTWDYQWNYAIWNSGGKVITPNVNLIRNIGFGKEATHTFDETSKFSNLKVSSIESILHPSSTKINEIADLYTQANC